jgi:DNA-binding GntR family transcriptional regulator
MVRKLIADLDGDNFDKQTLADKVLDKLMDWIMEGKIVMGQKLNTDQLAQQLSVSRMPVRDAIKELEKKGLIENIPYKGASLVNLSSDDVFQMYLLRSLIEPEICWYACKNASDEEIEYVGKVLDAFNKELEGDISAVQIFQYNRQFHFSLFDTSHMDKLIEVANRIWDNLAFCKLIYGQRYVMDDAMRQRQSIEHGQYYNLFKNRKADELKALVKKNLENFEEIMPKMVTDIKEK